MELRRFSMIAYSGGEARGAMGRVVIDLAGLNHNGHSHPILRQHDPNRVIGYSDRVEKGPALNMAGYVSDVNDAGRELIALSDAGAPWQASVGIDIDEVEAVAQGQSTIVNGRSFAGPGAIIRRSTLREASFVPLGADKDTRATVAAAVR